MDKVLVVAPSTVFVVMSKWPQQIADVRVFANLEAAQADCVGGRTYAERPVLQKVVCPHCGAERGA